VIRRYRILNDQVGREDAFLAGIPYPGTYVTDEAGVVVAKFFHDTYKKRNSPEMLIDAALGRIVVSDDAPRVRGGDEQVRISMLVHGGNGKIRSGIVRQLVVRFELGERMHIYGDPVPEGMVATRVAVSGPPGLVFEESVFPPTQILHLESMGMELPVWSGVVDVVVPFYATGVLASETRPLDVDSVEIEANVRYQACGDEVCFAPTAQRLALRLALDVVDVPSLGVHQGHGQREGNFSSTPHMVRLLLRKLRQYPLGLPRFLWKTLRLELAARRRSRNGEG
jgi:Disulphide bond corrector protein DsbC